MSFTATATRSHGLEFRVDVNGRHELITDEPRSVGGTDVGPAPHELLPAALASCVGTTVAMFAERRGWEVGEIAVDVDYDKDVTPRRFAIVLRLAAELSEEQRTAMERVAAACPLRRALEAGFEFEESSESLHLAASPLL